MKIEALLLFACFILLAVLPVLPALIHLWGPESSAFLDIPPDRDDDPRYFSKRLKSTVAQTSPQSRRIVMVAEGADVQKSLGPISLDPVRRVSGSLHDPRIAVLAPKTVLPAGLQWFGDVLALADIEIPEDTRLRTLRCDGRCLIHPRARILRWLDGRSVFIMGPGILPPRTTASQTLSLSVDIHFERLHAPLITAQPSEAENSEPIENHLPPLPPDVQVWRLDADDEILTGHKRFDDDVYLCADNTLNCDVVCHGDLHVGARTLIKGNLKVNGDLFMHAGARLQGHVLCQGSITLDCNCSIDGVMTALKHLSIARGCQLGSEKTHTSLIADTITLQAGATIHGQIWARSQGFTHA